MSYHSNHHAEREFEAFLNEMENSFSDEDVFEYEDTKPSAAMRQKLKSTRYVQWIQYALNTTLNKRMEMNGKLGSTEKSAIKEFRLREGISSTKVFDEETEQKLATLVPHKPEHFTAVCIHSELGVKTAEGKIITDRMIQFAEQEYALWGNGTITETQSAGDPMRKKYWQDTVNNLYGFNKIKHWSGVFISWVVKQAGGGDHFFIDDSHSVYTFFTKLNRKRTGLLFRAYRIHDIKPERGDIIVANRAKVKAHYDNISPSTIASHGQVVVDVSGNKLFTIGGNEANASSGGKGVTVNRKELALHDGYLPCDKGFYAIIRLDKIDAPALTFPAGFPFLIPPQNEIYYHDHSN